MKPAISGMIIFVTVFLFAGRSEGAPASLKEDVKSGNLLYNNKNYKEAEKKYEEALSGKPGSGIANFNIGAAQYKENSYLKAVGSFNKAVASGDNSLIWAADYNTGNCQYKLGEQVSSDREKAKEYFETALKFYKRSMELNPDDRDAKFNYEFVDNKLKELSAPPEKKEDEKKNQNKDKKDDKDKGQGSGGKGQNEKENKDKKKDDQKDKQQQQQQQNQNQQQQQQQKEKQDAGSGGQGPKEKQKDEGQEKEDQGAGGQEQDKENQKEEEKQKGQEAGGQGQQEKKDEQKKQQGQEGEEQEEKQNEKEGQGQAGGQAEQEKEKPEAGKDSKGLEFYQAPQGEGEEREMTKEEAAMLLEGYKGEEATGRQIRMRREAIRVSDPDKDW